MSDFTEKLRLKEAADEDLYFAKQDLDLIKALHKKKLAKLAECSEGETKSTRAFEERFEAISEKHKEKPHKLLRAYRDLLDEIRDSCKRRS